jgi:hypothetical protein
MSSRQQYIRAPADVVYQLLSDVGGWRIWNRRVAFSEWDGEMTVGGRGVLYLRSMPWLPWSLHVEQLSKNQQLLFCANCLSMHVHVKFELETDDTGQVLLRGALFSNHVLGRMVTSKLLPFWRGFLSEALAGVCYAAESVSAAQH